MIFTQVPFRRNRRRLYSPDTWWVNTDRMGRDVQKQLIKKRNIYRASIIFLRSPGVDTIKLDRRYYGDGLNLSWLVNLARKYIKKHWISMPQIVGFNTWVSPSFLVLQVYGLQHVENTDFRMITDVKQRQAWSLPRWLTVWKYQKL